MNLWVPVAVVALFIAIIIVRGIRDGKKEGARLEGAFEDLERKKCPSCSRAYGPMDRLSPYAQFIPDPNFGPSPCQNFWRVTCPRCRHEAVIGLPVGVMAFVIVPPADAEHRTKSQRR